MFINKIVEHEDIKLLLESTNLKKQYLKAKKSILWWDIKSVNFKKRKPKTLKIYQFRINKKYRAFWFFDPNNKTVFKVIEINDHQN